MHEEAKIPTYSFHKYNLARDYLRAARLLSCSANPPNLPLASLYTHSLELAFKCFLTLEGCSKNYIRKKISHDISKAMNRSKELGLVVNSEMEELVSLLSPLHQERCFNYFERSLLTLPDPQQCIALIEHFLKTIEPRTDEQTAKALRGEPAI
ncbi:hypothetical protein [Rubritalea sp.]|uniref:hypothetical protein n=1 Tax=Rubritalea sp. TaxID=2109375 RepID=UPI003EF498D5